MCGAGVMTSSPPEGVSSQPATSTTDPKPAGESRKVRKPLMEKRRRARINESLNELKRMLMDSDKTSVKEGSKATKLEKADILELTVQRLQRLEGERDALKGRLEVAGRRFDAGYRECAREAARLLGAADPALRERLSRHLAASLGRLEQRHRGPPTVLRPTRLPNGDLAFVIPANLRAARDHDPVWRPW